MASLLWRLRGLAAADSPSLPSPVLSEAPSVMGARWRGRPRGELGGAAAARICSSSASHPRADSASLSVFMPNRSKPSSFSSAASTRASFARVASSYRGSGRHSAITEGGALSRTDLDGQGAVRHSRWFPSVRRKSQIAVTLSDNIECKVFDALHTTPTTYSPPCTACTNDSQPCFHQASERA
jgi:hypothetical protein